MLKQVKEYIIMDINIRGNVCHALEVSMKKFDDELDGGCGCQNIWEEKV